MPDFKLISFGRLSLLLIIIFSFQFSSCTRNAVSTSEDEYFYNPVVADNADPWVIQYNGYYYYCFSDNDSIYVTKSHELQNIGREKSAAVWGAVKGTNYADEIWAPELHRLQNKWYVYFAADDGNNDNHRLYVIEGFSDDPQERFTLKGRIHDPSDKWAIDGTVLEYNEKLYFIWSGWEGDVNVKQNIYIAPMSDPCTISGNRVLISSPELSWELNGDPLINEGPGILRNDNQLFLIYSASGSWTDHYCLGMLVLTGGDVLSRTSWTKHPRPVFAGTDSVISPGHASYVKSRDGSENWIVYHAAKHRGAGWDRNVRIQSFTWKENGYPDFGNPLPLSTRIKAPK